MAAPAVKIGLLVLSERAPITVIGCYRNRERPRSTSHAAAGTVPRQAHATEAKERGPSGRFAR